MAFGQIDPARLEGEALRRWYLRSPQEIEEEHRANEVRAYDAFFSRSDHGQGLTPQGRRVGQGYKMAAASPRGFLDYWSPRGCSSCHGYTPETLPPVGGQPLFPPNTSPRSGG